jgi:hypothetical protein
MHASCTLLAVDETIKHVPWEEFTCKWDFSSCIIYVTFLSCSYIQFLLYVVLLFKQPQLLFRGLSHPRGGARRLGDPRLISASFVVL